MKIIKTRVKHDLNITKYIDGRTCFFDIETTGFSRSKDIVYLIGLIYEVEPSIWEVIQFFAESEAEEADLIQAFIEKASDFQNIISFNGDSFDLPYLKSRSKELGLDFSLKYNSLDLYSYIKSNKEFLRLENLKLKTIEKALGIDRTDKYSGFECIKFYKDYLKVRDPKLKEKILKHNYDDIVNMLDLMRIIDLIKDKKNLSFKLGLETYELELKSYNITKNQLHVRGRLNKPFPMDLKIFGDHTILSNSRDLDIKTYLNKAYISEDTLGLFVDIRNFKRQLPLKYMKFLNLPSQILVVKSHNTVIGENLIYLISLIMNNLE